MNSFNPKSTEGRFLEMLRTSGNEMLSAYHAFFLHKDIEAERSSVVFRVQHFFESPTRPGGTQRVYGDSARQMYLENGVPSGCSRQEFDQSDIDYYSSFYPK